MKKMIFMVLSFVLAVAPISAFAAEANDSELNIGQDGVSIRQVTVFTEPSEEEPYILTLDANEPVEVTFPDGHTEIFEYQLKTDARSKEIEAAVRRKIWTMESVLWANSVFENRRVELVGDANFDYYGLFISVQANPTITQRVGYNNTFAKARVRGTVSFLDAATRTFDYEMWVDPANSQTAKLVINI